MLFTLAAAISILAVALICAVWMGGVGQKVAPAVRPALFNGDLAGRQTGRERLLGNDFRVGNDRSVDDHRRITCWNMCGWQQDRKSVV